MRPMRLYTFDASAGRAIANYGSVGLTVTHILHAEGEAQTVAMWLASGGSVGRHEADCGQLFLVTQGAGWVEGGDGARREIHAGQAAWWNAGEAHASGSETGMAALVIEGDALDVSRLRPLE